MKASTTVYWLMRTYNRRLARIARARRARGALGRENSCRQFLFQSFSISARDLPRVGVAALGWLMVELKEGWRSWFRSGASGEQRVTDAAAPAPLVSNRL